jgi:hypothetical protein
VRSMRAVTRKIEQTISYDEPAWTEKIWLHFEGYIEFCCSGAKFVDSDLSCRKKVFLGHARTIQANPGIYQGAPLNQASSRAGGGPCRSGSPCFRCRGIFALIVLLMTCPCSNTTGGGTASATPQVTRHPGPTPLPANEAGEENACHRRTSYRLKFFRRRLCKNDSTLLYRTTSDPQIQQQDPARHHQVNARRGTKIARGNGTRTRSSAQVTRPRTPVLLEATRLLSF